MTLKAQVASDVTEVFLNSDDFAETGTYIPKSGDARSIVAVVEEQAQQLDENNNVILGASIHVFVSRDATEGIDAPQLGEQFCRENDRLKDGQPDPDKCYSYSGVIDESDDATATAWTLVFTRNRPFEIGGNRR